MSHSPAIGTLMSMPWSRLVLRPLMASPNNPTGVATPHDDLARLIVRAPGFVILDQAYVEFTGADEQETRDFLRASDRLLIIRTLSKAWGLAGLRVGYGVGTPPLVAEVAKARGPYKVNVVAEQAAIAALVDDAGWVRARVEEAVANRRRLAERLQSLGLRRSRLTRISSLCPSPQLPAAPTDWLPHCGNRGILVRQFAGLPGIGDAIRITVGPWSIMEQLLSVVGQTVQRVEKRPPSNMPRNGSTRARRAPRATILDYGVGNLHSLVKALTAAGAQVSVDPDTDAALDTDLGSAGPD